MKLGVISDIHSNVYALSAVLEYMEKEKCDEYLLLGDYISDTANAVETMDMLYELMEKYPCSVLKGNREDYMLTQKAVREKRVKGPVWISGSGSGNLLYTYKNLRQKDFEFFESLPISFVYEKEGYPSITCCHGAPDNNKHLLQHGAEDTKQVLDSIDTDYLIAAHTHYQGVSHYGNKTYINTGSLGLSIGAPGKAHAVILESCGEEKISWKANLLEIPYDVEKTVRDIYDTGLYDMAPWFLNNNIHILLTGIDLTVELVKGGMKLKRETERKDNWPHVAEKYYEQTAKKIGLKNYTKEEAIKLARELVN